MLWQIKSAFRQDQRNIIQVNTKPDLKKVLFNKMFEILEQSYDRLSPKYQMTFIQVYVLNVNIQVTNTFIIF